MENLILEFMHELRFKHSMQNVKSMHENFLPKIRSGKVRDTMQEY